jgi:hypothetical protein
LVGEEAEGGVNRRERRGGRELESWMVDRKLTAESAEGAEVGGEG